MDPRDTLTSALAGRYEIDREIGRGGMATVYLARDVRHNRNVALKVLNPELGAILGVERFLAEIQVTANLQHPNLLPLFDSGEANGLLFYVMPYVEGESLRARLEREKQLPVDEAVRITTAIAGALDYAHRHQVIHRDLKPENILMQEGQPLIADFGIALAVSKAGGARITQTGLSLGTPQYMSPEQATGDRVVDGRSDIYSLGAMLYEMLVGDPPHSASTAQAIIAKVLTEKPQSVLLSRPNVPPAVEYAIGRALEKLAADRFSTAKEFAEALGHSDAPDGFGQYHKASSVGSGIRRRVPLATAVAASAIAVIGISTLVVSTFVRRALEAQPSVALVIDPPLVDGQTSLFQSVAIAPDGQTVVFAVSSDTTAQLFSRALREPVSHPVANSLGAFDAFFSPDSREFAAFFSDGVLRRMSLDRSGVSRLAQAPLYFSGGTWGRNGRIIIGAQGSGENGLRELNAAGEVSRPITEDSVQHARPTLLADGETLLFTSWGPGFTEDDFLAIGSRATGEFSTTKLVISKAFAAVDGHALVVTPDGAIKAVPFDARNHQLTGEPIRLEEGVIAGQSNTIQPASLAGNGTLAYVRGAPGLRLMYGDSTAVKPLSAPKRLYRYPVMSPDGRRVAVTVGEQRGDTAVSDAFVVSLDGQPATRLTTRGDVQSVAWSADGRDILFTTWYQSKPSIWRQSATSVGVAEKLIELPSGGDFLWNAESAPGGRAVVYCQAAIDLSKSQLFVLALDSARKPQLIAGADAYNCSPRVSPDGNWLAFEAGPTSTLVRNVFVRRLYGDGPPVQVSLDGGDQPVWSADGSRIFYRHNGVVWTAAIRHQGSMTTVVSRVPAFPNVKGIGEFAISPDGKKLLTAQQDAGDVRIVVVTNWLRGVRERLASARKR